MTEYIIWDSELESVPFFAKVNELAGYPTETSRIDPTYFSEGSVGIEPDADFFCHVCGRMKTISEVRNQIIADFPAINVGTIQDVEIPEELPL